MTVDLGVQVDGAPRFYMCSCLPFGYQNSPYVWARWFKTGVIAEARRQGLHLVCYADDVLLCSSTSQQSIEDGELFDRICADYGVTLAKDKGVRVPTQKVVYLGLEVDSERNLFLVPPSANFAFPKRSLKY